MIWPIINESIQIIMCLCVVFTTGVWLYIFRWYLKHHLMLRQRVDVLEKKITEIVEFRYRGCL